MALASERARGGSPLRRREFRLYFAGNLTSNIGSWISNVALAVTMHDLTHSSFWVGLTVLGLFLPVLLIALPAGALADRRDRLRLLRGVQVWMASLATILTVLVALDAATRVLLVAMSFGLGLGIAVGIPAMQAMVPLMVPRGELGDAIRLNALTFNLARAVGPLIAAALLTTVGATWAFAINAISFFALVAALTMIRSVPFPRESDGEPGPVRDGVAYAWRHLRTRWLLLSIVAIGIALDPIFTLSPAIAGRVGLGSGGAGWLVATWGAGAVLMIVFGRRVINAMTAHGLGWIGLLALAAGIITYGLASTLASVVVGALLAGGGYITATMAFTTTIQEDVPESLRGRVSALWTLAFLGPRAFAGVLDGLLADALGTGTAAVVLASVAIGAAVLLRRVATPHVDPISPPA
jgi:MFS family permease